MRGGRKDKSIPWSLESNEDGWPVLPEEDNLRAPDLKDIVRSFITLTYSESTLSSTLPSDATHITGRMTNNELVAVPWGAIANDQDKYLDWSYLPAGAKIREPSKMLAMDVRTLFRHWKKRQTRGRDVFRFKMVEKSHVRVPVGKRRKNFDWSDMRWMDDSDAEGLSDLEREYQKRKGKGKKR